jgi:hypothetical protein
MSNLQRREFIKLLASAGLVSTGVGVSSLSQAASFTPYDGPIYITLAAVGGWDVTSFCDPKAVSSINTWAANGGAVQTIDNSPITYAPFASNASFFNNHHEKMLVVNGLDTQTNAHTAGVRHTWSGRFANGYPSFTALAGAINGAQLPLSYISNGGFRDTANLIPVTLLSNPEALRSVVEPNTGPSWSGAPQQQYKAEQIDIIRAAREQRLSRLLAKTDHTPRFLQQLGFHQTAFETSPELTRIMNYVPQDLASTTDNYGNYNPLPRQIQLTLAACAAGLTASADLTLGGFDTHDEHDRDHAPILANFTDGIDFFWQEAVRQGIADRITLVVSSDFSRTPEYNDGNGKDHWPISSAIIMQNSPSWGNQVVGSTDDGHNTVGLNTNLTVGGSNTIQPKHLQQLLRQMAGFDQHAYAQALPLDAGDLDLYQVLVGI